MVASKTNNWPIRPVIGYGDSSREALIHLFQEFCLGLGPALIQKERLHRRPLVFPDHRDEVIRDFGWIRGGH